MTGIRIVGADLHTGSGLDKGAVVIADGHIESVTETARDTGGYEIDATGLIVAPGFIDLQINGGFGIDLLSDPDALWDVGRQLPKHGVTGFLPTIITSPPSARNSILASLSRRPAHYVGAEPLGAHFEGPMLSPLRPGTHPLEHLLTPTMALIEHWSRTAGVALVTIAPELPGAHAVIEELVRQEVTVAAGHSNATKDEAQAGFVAGVSMVTHLFNAMAPLGHRSPNLVGVALAESDVVAGLIVDGVHVDPTVVATAWLAKGPAGIALVTDAVAAMGQEPGRYNLADRSIVSDGASVRDSDGNLAGSVLTMDRAVRNLVSYTDCETHEALSSASRTPAHLIGRRERGRIAAGQVADLVVLDRDLEVQMTICSGKLAHIAEAARSRVPTQLMEVEPWKS